MIGLALGLIAVFLAWYWYDWRLVLIILLAITGNNLEQKK